MQAVIIAEIEKNGRELVRVTLEEFKGHRLASVRVWARDPDKGTVPTRQGVALRVSLLPALLAALQDATHQARLLGLLEGHADG